MHEMVISTRAEADAAVSSLEEWDSGRGWSLSDGVASTGVASLALRLASGEPPFSLHLDEGEADLLASALEMSEGDLFRFPRLAGVTSLRAKLGDPYDAAHGAAPQRLAWSLMRMLSPSVPSWAKPYFA